MVVNLTGYGVGIEGTMYFLTELFSLSGLQVVLGTFAFLFSVGDGFGLQLTSRFGEAY